VRDIDLERVGRPIPAEKRDRIRLARGLVVFNTKHVNNVAGNGPPVGPRPLEGAVKSGLGFRVWLVNNVAGDGPPVGPRPLEGAVKSGLGFRV